VVVTVTDAAGAARAYTIAVTAVTPSQADGASGATPAVVYQIQVVGPAPVSAADQAPWISVHEHGLGRPTLMSGASSALTVPPPVERAYVNMPGDYLFVRFTPAPAGLPWQPAAANSALQLSAAGWRPLAGAPFEIVYLPADLSAATGLPDATATVAIAVSATLFAPAPAENPVATSPEPHADVFLLPLDRVADRSELGGTSIVSAALLAGNVAAAPVDRAPLESAATALIVQAAAPPRRKGEATAFAVTATSMVRLTLTCLAIQFTYATMVRPSSTSLDAKQPEEEAPADGPSRN